MKSSIISTIIVVIVLAAGAYWYFFVGTGNQAPLTTSAPSGNAAQTQFQALVSELQPISFNTTIFSDPKFSALVNLATAITPEPAGRLDPFAPVASVTGI
jgi:flagellar basal body-associated protein FliL